MLFNKFLPKVSEIFQKKAQISFYLWSLALVVVSGRTVEFIISQDKSNYIIEILLAIFSFFVCVLQFWLGRKIGRKHQDTVAGGQGLGQKNTILAIWMAQVYLNPIASIGPGAYVLWQNIINSWQVWRNRKSLQ
jgi:BASS family bile acid:Na+ symporter